MKAHEKVAFVVLGGVALAALVFLVVGFVRYPGDGLRAVGVIVAVLVFIWAVWTGISWFWDNMEVENE